MKATLLIMLLFLVPPPAFGAAPFDLYSGEAAVGEQDAAERRRAVPDALAEVLRKLSGLRQFDELPQVTEALGQADSMLLSYHYREAELPRADGGADVELRLVARFATAEVDALARSLQLPLWPPQRPPLTAWLVVDDGVDRRVMPVELDYMRQWMEDVATRRGLPLAWPQPGEDGEYGVDLQILWGGYAEDLAAVSGPDNLIVAARREGVQWGVRLNLAYGGQLWNWRLDDVDLQAALIEGMHQVVDQIASARAIVATDLGSWQQDLEVAGLVGATDYERCLAYLQSLSVVTQVDVVSARPGMVTFRVSLSAMPRYLDEALTRDAVLGRDEPEGPYVLLRDTDVDG
jgi:hypothetical protein